LSPVEQALVAKEREQEQNPREREREKEGQAGWLQPAEPI
jgi:hypothetical protein